MLCQGDYELNFQGYNDSLRVNWIWITNTWDANLKLLTSKALKDFLPVRLIWKKVLQKKGDGVLSQRWYVENNWTKTVFN